MPKITLSLYFFIILALSGCATPYQPMGLTGGYSDIQLSKDTYQVSFSGNGFTSSYSIENLLLHRCAELTRDKGYKYFVILGGNEKRNDSQYTTPTTVNTYGTGNIYGNGYANTNYYGNEAYTNSSFNGGMYSTYNTTINPGMTYNIQKYTDCIFA